MSSLCAMVAGKRRGVGPTLLLAWCSLIFPLRNSAYVLTRPMVPSGSMNTGIRARGRGVREGIKNNLMGCGFSGMRLGEVEDLLGKGTGRLLGLSMVFDQFDPRGRSKVGVGNKKLKLNLNTPMIKGSTVGSVVVDMMISWFCNKPAIDLIMWGSFWNR